jgi:arsenate reductase
MDKHRKKRVMFLCTGNSARSQMAEGLMRHLRGNEFEVFSAGTEPKGIHPLAIEVMAEIGIDIYAQRSKHLDEYGEEEFNYIVTLCDHAAKTCPFFPGKGERIHHSLPDPAVEEGSREERLEMFRRVRDELRECILSFPDNRKMNSFFSKSKGGVQV